MENINAVLIDEGVLQRERLIRLNQIAINQMRVLENDENRNLLKWHEWIGLTYRNNMRTGDRSLSRRNIQKYNLKCYKNEEAEQYLSPMICPYDSPAWQLASCRPTNTAKAQRHALCEYMPLRPCAISDLCKTCFTSRVGGITVIYQCVVIHSAFELGLLVAKLRYIYDTTKKKN